MISHNMGICNLAIGVSGYLDINQGQYKLPDGPMPIDAVDIIIFSELIKDYVTHLIYYILL